MQLPDTLDGVLQTARDHAGEADRGQFPAATVAALRSSGLLGLTLPVAQGGLGGGPRELVEVVSQLAGACGSSAMIYLMHVSAAMATAAAPPPGQPDLVREMARGASLATLAFSEVGSRSHFWAPVSQSQSVDHSSTLRATKSFVTSAGHADVYLVSTLTAAEAAAVAAPVPVDIFVVPAGAPGVSVTGEFRGLGLRGNASAPMTFNVTVDHGARLGSAGGGFGLMVETVMPWFNLGNAAVSLGLAEAAVNGAVRHASGARLEHLGQSLAQLPTIRAQLARASLELAATRSYVRTAADAIASPTESTPLHVLGVKAYANDSALRITDAAMRVCGGAAFSESLQLERFFRDARAGTVMAPTADVLYDFYGKAITGQPLF